MSGEDTMAGYRDATIVGADIVEDSEREAQEYSKRRIDVARGRRKVVPLASGAVDKKAAAERVTPAISRRSIMSASLDTGDRSRLHPFLIMENTLSRNYFLFYGISVFHYYHY